MIEIELKIDSLNTKNYYIKGTYIHHREGGPAVEWSNGDKWWYQNGKLHRLDGPAIEYANGNKSWYLDGQRMDCQTQEQFEKLMKLKAFW